MRPRMIKAAVLYKPGDIRLKEVKMPEVAPDQVLVKVKAVGICGSDIHYYKEGRIGPYVVEKPIILGHECSGEIVEIGKKVKKLKVGDRVILEPGVPCRKCIYCRTGRYNLCREEMFMATPPFDGAFVEYVSFPFDFTYKIPDHLSFEEAALIEPLAVGVFAIKRANLSLGDSLAILGAGPIGLVTLQVGRARGAGEIYVIDLIPGRLEMASKLGARAVINAERENVPQRISELTQGRGVDAVFEAAGAVTSTQMAVDLVKRGGKIVLVGLPGEDRFPFQMMKIITEELDVIGVFRYANVHPQAIELVSQGKVDLKSLITHRFPLERTQEALELADKRKDIAIKTLIKL